MSVRFVPYILWMTVPAVIFPWYDSFKSRGLRVLAAAAAIFLVAAVLSYFITGERRCLYLGIPSVQIISILAVLKMFSSIIGRPIVNNLFIGYLPKDRLIDRFVNVALFLWIVFFGSVVLYM
jgi:hypothetical protein